MLNTETRYLWIIQKLLKIGINGIWFAYIKNMYKGIIILVSKYAFMIFHIIFVIVKLVHDKEKLKVYSYSCSPRLSINLKIIC